MILTIIIWMMWLIVLISFLLVLEDWSDNLIERNPRSMFLTDADEKEIIDILNKCSNRMFTDYDDIDMKLVKKIIDGISEPLTYICNLSFQTSKFPNIMKIA